MEKCLKSHTERLVATKAKSSELNLQHVYLGDPAQGCKNPLCWFSAPLTKSNSKKQQFNCLTQL